jgi:hypothetical protein
VVDLRLLLQMAKPTPAHAWWEFIEPLSGPGRFYGWDIQVRLFCLVEAGNGRRSESPPRRLAHSVCLHAEPGRARRLSVDVGAHFCRRRTTLNSPMASDPADNAVSVHLDESPQRWTNWDFIDYDSRGRLLVQLY